MSHPLSGAWAKIERAREQVRHLDREVGLLLASGWYNIVGENQTAKTDMLSGWSGHLFH